MNQKYLKINELRPYSLYRIHARNSNYGIWIPERNSFLISRFKFMPPRFCFEEYHWDSSKWHGTAKPLEEIEQSPFKFEDMTQITVVKDDLKCIQYKKESEILKYLDKFVVKDCELCGCGAEEWIRHLPNCPNRTKID